MQLKLKQINNTKLNQIFIYTKFLSKVEGVKQVWSSVIGKAGSVS